MDDNHPRLTPINHYGLHRAEDSIAYLHQGRPNAPNFIGLQKPSPFQQKPEGAKACPHLINMSSPMPDRNHMGAFCELYPDLLVQYMLPIPKPAFDKVPYLNDPNNDLAMTLTILGKLCSPLQTIVHPLNSLNERTIVEKLNLTNLAPLVLTGVRTEDQSYINRLAKEAQIRPRRLILTGDPMVVVRDPMVRLTTYLWEVDAINLVQLPMEQLGVMALRRYARGEQIDAPYSSRDK